MKYRKDYNSIEVKKYYPVQEIDPERHNNAISNNQVKEPSMMTPNKIQEEKNKQSSRRSKPKIFKQESDRKCKEF